MLCSRDLLCLSRAIRSRFILRQVGMMCLDRHSTYTYLCIAVLLYVPLCPASYRELWVLRSGFSPMDIYTKHPLTSSTELHGYRRLCRSRCPKTTVQAVALSEFKHFTGSPGDSKK